MSNFIYTACILAALIGVYGIILSYQKKQQIANTISNGKLAEGTVIELRKNEGDWLAAGDAGGFAPVVEFKTPNGLFRHYSNTYSLPSKYEVGQVVELYYHSYRSIKNFTLIDDKPGPLPGYLLKCGLLLCAMGVPVVLYKLKQLLW